MGMIEGGKLCRGDDDCSALQYCYDVSNRCVDYTQCNRYNRQEGVRHARDPSHCGPCLTGYSSERLGTGEMAILCKKNNVHETITEPNDSSSVDKISITAGVLFIILVLMVLFGILFKRRRSAARQDNNHKQWSELCVVGPSAPPAENSPFIGYGNTIKDSTYNNNRNLMDKNRLVKAAPCKEPNWIRTNPHYEYNMGDDNLNVTDASHFTGQIQPADTNSNSWTPEQLTIQMANRNVVDYGVEQIDNTMNAVLVQRNEASTSNEPESNNNHTNNNSNGTTPESNDAQDNRERVRASNILITQKISMNVNVHNADF